MTSALVLGRLRKGRPIRPSVLAVGRQLRQDGWKVETKVVTRKRDLRREAAKAVAAGLDVVVAVGGDGAVMHVAMSLAKSDVALGIVPMGTGNLLAGNLDIPHDRARAVEIVLNGRHRRIDVGRVVVDGGRRYNFTVACGVGFDASVMGMTTAGQKRRWGKFAYLANAVAKANGIHNTPHTITLDGSESTTDAAQVLIANFGRMVAGIEPDRAISADDGVLDVIALRASGWLGGLLAGWDALRQHDLGEAHGGRAIRAQARRIAIATTPSQPVEVDGSVVGTTPIKVSILPEALTVIVPAA